MGEISGEGILCTVEFVKDKHNHIYFDPADKIGPQVSAALLAQDKVIARAMPQGDILGFAPPFCLTQQEADTVVAATVRAVKKILGSINRFARRGLAWIGLLVLIFGHSHG